MCLCMCVRARVCVRVRAHVRVHVRCARACACSCACAFSLSRPSSWRLTEPVALLAGGWLTIWSRALPKRRARAPIGNHPPEEMEEKQD